MRVPLLLPCLLLAVAPAFAADPPKAPVTLAVIDPVTPPTPGPASVVQLDAGRGELLALTTPDGKPYTGKVRWRTSGPVVVAVTPLKAKGEVWFVGSSPARLTVPPADHPVDIVPGLKVSQPGPTKHTIGDAPAVLLEPTGTGEATVEADGTDANGDIVTLLSVTVRCGKAPQPPPGPDPKPPGPSDPLAAAMKAAYLADRGATKAADATQMAAVFRNAVDTAADQRVTTSAALLGAVRSAALSLVPADRLTGVREVAAAELDRQLGTAVGPLDAAARLKAADQFRRFAALYAALPN